jgi:hypothetical protein
MRFAGIQQHHQQAEYREGNNRQPPRPEHNRKKNKESAKEYPTPRGYFALSLH